MSMSKPKAPETPAQRPERQVEVEPEDIQIGTESDDATENLRTRGKRSLLRPTGATTQSGGGLQV